MAKVAPHEESDLYRYGWVTGFYDASGQEGVRHLDDLLRYGVRAADDEAFMSGYRAGRCARLGEPPLRPDMNHVPLQPAA